MLVLTGLDVSHGAVKAVRGVSLHVEQGEIVALIGANGAGKTSLLAAISGLIRPSAGSVVFDGRDITRTAPERIVSLGLSHVPERRLVFKPLSVTDNLLLGSYGRRGRASRAELDENLESIYAMFPVLGQRAGQPAGTLSGGEQQMLAIGRALMAAPRMLLLDEPGMGLAPTVRRDIFRKIAELRARRNLTVLLVEQNARSALAVSDRGYVLETGEVILRGRSQELLADKDMQQAYLGRDKSQKESSS
jgi:branched-chain amino acid transport system ATP-binding protein